MCERVCCATAFSATLDTNWRLLSGRKFSLIRSRSAFFSFGLTSAPFHSEGNFLSSNDRLIIRVITGSTSSKHSLSRPVGIGSLGHDLVGASTMSLLTDSGVIEVKLVKSCGPVNIFPGGRWLADRCVSESRSARMSAIFLMKNSPKSLASCTALEWGGRSSSFGAPSKTLAALKRER